MTKSTQQPLDPTRNLMWARLATQSLVDAGMWTHQADVMARVGPPELVRRHETCLGMLDAAHRKFRSTSGIDAITPENPEMPFQPAFIFADESLQAWQIIASPAKHPLPPGDENSDRWITRSLRTLRSADLWTDGDAPTLNGRPLAPGPSSASIGAPDAIIQNTRIIISLWGAVAALNNAIKAATKTKSVTDACNAMVVMAIDSCLAWDPECGPLRFKKIEG